MAVPLHYTAGKKENNSNTIIDVKIIFSKAIKHGEFVIEKIWLLELKWMARLRLKKKLQ